MKYQQKTILRLIILITFLNIALLMVAIIGWHLSGRKMMLPIYVAALSALIALPSSFLIIRNLSQGLGILWDMLARVRNGTDLSIRASTHSEDEIGSIIRALNHLLDDMSKALNKIYVETSAVFDSAIQIGNYIGEVAFASSAQAEAASSTAASIHELSSSIEQVAEYASSTKTYSHTAEQLSQQGANLARMVSASMESIAKSVTEASRLVANLANSGNEIGVVTKAIKGIADQTNLLALNASIEAARAGEHGKGFAVVADEVRKLADSTGLSTQQIAGIVTTIQEGTHATVANMNSSSNLVEEGVQLVYKASNSLTEINASAQHTLEQIKAIANSTSEQSIASNSINEHIAKIAEMAEGNLVTVRKSSQAVRALIMLGANLREACTKFDTGHLHELHIIFDWVNQGRGNAMMAANSETVDQAKLAADSVKALDKKIHEQWKVYLNKMENSQEKILAEDFMSKCQIYFEARNLTLERACSGNFDGARENATKNAGPKYRMMREALQKLIEFHDRAHQPV